MNAKKGMSHIEIIVSFIIFVAAVGFALYFFSPFGVTRLSSTYLDYTIREIKLNTSVEIETFSIKINNSTIQAENPGETVIAIKISDVDGGLKSYVETYDETILDSEWNSTLDLLYIKAPSWENIDFVSVKFGEEFNELGVGSFPNPNETFYEIASYDLEELISEKKFLDLNKSYYRDYRALKDSFNIRGANFGFSLTFSPGDEIVAERDIPPSLEVYSEIKRIEILRQNGKIKFADFRVWVW